MRETISTTCPRERYRVTTAPAFVGWSATPVVHGDLVLCAGSASPNAPQEDVPALFGHDAQTGQLRFEIKLPLEHPSPELVTSPPYFLSSGEIMMGVYARDEWLKLFIFDGSGRKVAQHEITEQEGENLCIFGHDGGNKLFVGQCVQLGSETNDRNRYRIVSWLYRQVRTYATAVFRPDGSRLIFPEWLLAAHDGILCGVETPRAGERLVARNLRDDAPLGEKLWSAPGEARLVLGVVDGLLWVLDYSDRDAARTRRKDAFVSHLIEHDLKDSSDAEKQHALSHPLRAGVPLTALDLLTGAPRWSVLLDGEPIAARLSGQRGAILITNEDRVDELVILSPTGQPLAQLATKRHSFPPAGPHLESQRGHAIVAMDDSKLLLLEEGALRCVVYATDTPVELWRLPLPESCRVEGFSPRVAERRLALPQVHAHDGTIYARCDNELYCFAADGDPQTDAS